MNSRHEDQQQRQQLLTIVDRGTVEQLFTFLQKFHRKPFQNLTDVMGYNGVIDDQIDFIDCTGTRYNVTPLIIAAGKGSYEKTKILLVHGANPNKQCATGDTALNLAVHRQKYPVIDLLLQYRANPNVYNQSGKTALHRAVVSYNNENANQIRTLLNAGADPYIEDRNQRIPLDEAVISNRPEIVEILLSHDRNLVQRAYRAAIIASRLGHDKCLEILLNYGMDPNIIDRTNTTPLHVAVRSLKLSTVRLLVAKGADQNIANNRGETALTIAEFLQPDQQQNFINALVLSEPNEIRNKKKLSLMSITNTNSTTGIKFNEDTSQVVASSFHAYTSEKTSPCIYPLLRNHPNWTLDSDEFRSQTAQNSSVQNLLDTSNTYWCCTQNKNAWIIFDLKQEYNIAGIRIIGCENQSTPKNGHIDVSNALNGPWLKVKDFICLLSQENKNDVFFSSLKTRFIRVFILDNYGGEDIRIQNIGFFGVEMRLVNLLREYGLENSLNTLLANGINDQETLDKKQDEILNSSDKYLHVNDHFQFIRLTESLRSPKLTFLEWFNPPQTTVIADEKLQTFSVAGDEGVTDRVKLEEKLENSPQATTVLMRDLEPIQGRSLVDFPDYTIKYPGRYKIRVISVESPDIHTPWQEIVVGPTLSSSNLNTAADEHLYLSTTTRLSNVSTIDNENKLFSQTEPTTTLTKNANRGFIIKLFDSENDNTEDDTYLIPLKSIENSPYCFSSTQMSHVTDNSHVIDNKKTDKPDHYTQTKLIDYYDHSTNTDEDYEEDTYSSIRSNSWLRQDKFLTPTKYRSVKRKPLSNIFPMANVGNQEVSDDNETLGYGEKIITPTKYRLQQDRANKLLNGGNTSRSQRQSPAQIEQENQLQQQQQTQHRYELKQELPQQQPSKHYQRQQFQQRNGLEREPSPQRQQSQYHQREQLQNRNGWVRESSPPQQQSQYHRRQQFRQRNESEIETLPQRQQSQKRNETEQESLKHQESQYHQQEQLQNRNGWVQESLQQQQPSQYYQRQQFQQRNGSERESSPPQQQSQYHQRQQSHKRNDSEQESLPPQQQSQYHQRQQFRQRNESETGTLPSQLKQQQFRKGSESEQDSLRGPPYYKDVQASSQLRFGSDDELQVQVQQQKLPIENIDQNHLKPLYNRYQIVGGNFELKENPSNNSLYTDEPKHTEMQLIFKATLQGPDVQERAQNSIHELVGNRSRTQSSSNINNQNNLTKTSYPNSPQSLVNVDRQDRNTTNLVSNRESEYQIRSNHNSRLTPISQTTQLPTAAKKSNYDKFPTTSNQQSDQYSLPPYKSLKTSRRDDYPSVIESNNQIITTNTNDYDHEGLRQRSRSSSQIYTSSNYDKNPLKHTDNFHSSLLLSSLKLPSKPLECKDKYFFGDNVQNQSSDDDYDEPECVTFGHDSQPRLLTNTRHNLNYSSTTNPRFSTKDNNISEKLQFEQHTDVGTTTGNSLTQQQPHSSGANQSTVGKNQDSQHKLQTLTSNNQIPAQVDYEISNSYTLTDIYNGKNQNITNSTSLPNGFQPQYQSDSTHYEANIGSNIKHKRSSDNFDQDSDDDNQPHYQRDDHIRDDDDNNDYQDDDHDIHDHDRDDHDEHNYHNSEDDDLTRDDQSHHASMPRQPGIDTLVEENPVRDISTNPLPPQYPSAYGISRSEPYIPSKTNKSKKGGLFSLFRKDKNKDIDKSNTKSSKQKSSQKKDKSRSKEKKPKR